MTKHLAAPVICRHIEQLQLEYRQGRSEKAAKLHSISRSERQLKSQLKKCTATSTFSDSSKSSKDYWAEKGEQGRWVRVHSTPRTVDFVPNGVAGGPGRKTRLNPSRVTKGIYSTGEKFAIKDDWTDPQPEDERNSRPWTGRTVFLVDRTHCDKYGTDQRRQRSEAKNRSISWADMED